MKNVSDRNFFLTIIVFSYYGRCQIELEANKILIKSTLYLTKIFYLLLIFSLYLFRILHEY
jgi:hypothetical protein